MSFDAGNPRPNRGACWHVVGPKPLVTVEHPGYVRNVDIAVDSLGGPMRLGKLLNSQAQRKSVKLHLRPEDPFRKPISSTQTDTQNIVLKITAPKRTGRKRKRGSSEPFVRLEPTTTSIRARPFEVLRSLMDNQDRYDIEVIGSSNETHRFRTLPDFQYALTNSPLVQSFRENILPFKYARLKDFHFDTTTKGPRPEMEMIPPPSFSQLDLPFNYQYHQNPAVKLTFDDDGRPTSTNTSIPRRTVIPLVDYDVEHIPTGPDLALLPESSLRPSVKEVLVQMRALLKTRPILTRRVARNLIPDSHERDIQTAFQYVGFTFRSGPWRDAVVKFGLDPRTDPAYRIYQTRTFQIKLMPSSQPGLQGPSSAAPNTNTGSGVYQRPLKPAADPNDTNTHIFTGTRLAADSRIWQACDVVDAQLADLLARSPVRTVCHVRNDGWYPNGTWAAFHVVMRDKIAVLAAGEMPEDAWYERLLAVMPHDITPANVGSTIFSARADATPREVALASDIRGLAKDSHNITRAKPGWLDSVAGTRAKGSLELQHNGTSEEGEEITDVEAGDDDM